VVLCPRSNEYLENGLAPVRRMLDAGIAVGLGTDSLASNSDLDLFEEARALKDAAPDVDASEIMAMMTTGGAKTLGLENEFGAIEQGKQGDIAVFRATGDDPITALFEEGGRSSVEAVVSGGVFRVIDGGPVFAVSPVERASHMARQKASLALQEGGSGYL
jgi:cytosine/adenosine deaminase-related metal-dependent hydrolase